MVSLHLTGASGFLGQQLLEVLNNGFQVHTIGRGASNTIRCDLSIETPSISEVDVVIHTAAKAHVYPRTAAEKQAFFDINVGGTRHLLSALERTTVQRFVFISSVSVYGLSEGEGISEDTLLQGNTPYAKSKIEAEALVEKWCEAQQVAYLILRLPLISGPNPKGNLGKLVEAISKGRYLRIAKGSARKSIVRGADVARLIADWLVDPSPVSGIYNLTDGYHPSFYELEEAIRIALGKGKLTTLPLWMATMAGRLGDYLPGLPVNSSTIQKITQSFTFSDAKAREELGWSSTPVLSKIDELVSG